MNRLRTARTDERGAAAILVAVTTCVVLFIVAALTVDIGNTWARRGSLQSQADHAAKLAAEMLPVEDTTVPSTPTASQLKVAKTAAYYIACHRVQGQQDLSIIPACPTASTYLTDTAIDTFAKAMLANGKSMTPSHIGTVSFPTVNRVKVTSPSARIEFGFAKIAGEDDSIQSKSATAVVLSPGDLLPVGMSATCIANAVGKAPLGLGDTISKLIPINYLSTGSPNQSGAPAVETPTDGLVDWSDIYNDYNNKAATLDLNAISIKPSGDVDLTFYWRGNKNGWTVMSLKIYIRKEGYRVGDPLGLWETAELSTGLLGKAEDITKVPMSLPPGRYQAMIRVHGTNLVNWQYWRSNNHVQFVIPDNTLNLVSCARPMQSPRMSFSSPTGDADAMGVNFAQGLDHGLAHFPALVNALDGVNISPSLVPTNNAVGNLVATANSVFQCDTNVRVKTDYPTRREDGANCFHVDTAQDWSTAVTKGLLTGGTTPAGAYNGRLSCPMTGQCNYKSTRAVLTNPGGVTGTYNNDRFEDFVKSGSLLNDPFFMALDSFLSPSVPLVTPPNDLVEEALYDSPRFFWAPVSLSLFTTLPPGAAGHHPILTFRPVFLTSESSTSTLASSIDLFLMDLITASLTRGVDLKTTLQYFANSALSLNPCSGVLSIIDLLLGILSLDQLTACELKLLKTPIFGGTGDTVGSFLEQYLGTNILTRDSANTGSFGGLVIDKAAAKVRAARIMTIAPGALPAVPQDYAGPTTDYLGTGPKIIRLVK
jgi:hypothetical protein